MDARYPSSKLAALLLAGAVTVHGQVLSESFMGATTVDPNWVFAGVNYTPVLTGDGVARDGVAADTLNDGWLRLTNTDANIATSAYNNTAFDAAGTTIYASFEYASWGGSGADGIAFFLFDGSETFSVGAGGGSLGYAQKSGTGATDSAGLAGGYIGVALDEYGNFSNPTEGRVGGPGRTIDSISVRGDEASGYAYLGGSSTLATSIDTPNVSTRPSIINTVQILLTATNQLTVTLQQGTFSAQTVLQLDLSSSIRPNTLKLGFTSGTGGANNFHEIRNVEASTISANKWDNGNGGSLWGQGVNWVPDNVPGVGADILFDDTYVSTNQTIDTQTDRTVRSLTFDAPIDYTINNNTLIFDSNNTPGFSGIATSEANGVGNFTINSDLQADNDITVRNNNSGNLILNGDLDTGGNTITFDGIGNSASENGSITGTGNIIKNDSGTLTLAGSNTYTGTTVINNGTIIAANDNALGDTAAGTTIDELGTLSLTNNIAIGAEALANAGVLENTSGSNSYAGVISGTGDVNVEAGDLTLSGANTYTGDTNVNAGTLIAGASNVLSDTTAVTVAGGGTFDLNDQSDTVGSIAGAGSITLGSGSLTTGGDNTDTTFSGLISETGNLAKAGTGTLTLAGANTYTGSTQIEAGTVVIANDTALGTTAAGTSISSGANLALTNNITVAETLANDGTLANNSGTNTFSGDVSGTGAVNVVSGQLTLSGNNTYAGTTNIATGGTLVATNSNSLGSPGGGTAIASGGTLSLTNNIAIGAEALANAGVLENTSGSNSYAGDISGTGGVTVASGELTLSGANTYTGATTINDGTLALGASNALGNGSNVSIGSTGVLDLDGNSQAIGNLSASDGATLDFGSPGEANTFVFDTYTPPASGIFVVNNWEDGTDQLATTVATQDVTSVYLSGYGVAQQDTGLTTLNGGYGDAYLLGFVPVLSKEWDGSASDSWTRNNNWTSTGDPSATQIALFDDLGEARPVVDLDGSRTIAGIEFGDLGSASYSLQDVSGSGNVLTLDGAIPFIQQKNALDQTITNMTLNLGKSTVADITGAGDLIVSANITQDSGDTNSLVRDGLGTGKLVLSGTNTFSGGVFVNTGIVEAQSDTALGTGDATVADAGTLEVSSGVTIANNIATAGIGVGGNGSVRSTSGINTLSGTISGSGSVQVDADSLTLSGANTYTGTTTIASGSTLVATNSNSLGSAAGGTTIAGGGTLSLTNNIAIGAEAVTNNGNLENTSGTNSLGGVVSGSGAVDVLSGQLTLSGANTYTGTTTIASGSTLVATNSNSLGSTVGGTTVGSGAQLQLSGVAIGNEALTLNGAGISSDGALRATTGTNSWSGTVTLDSNSRIESAAGANLTVSGVIAGGANSLTVGGAGATTLSGDNTYGTLTKTGSGQLTLSGGDKTVTTTNVTDGTVTLATSDILSDGMALDVSGGTFAMGGAITETIDTLTQSNGALDVDGVLTLNGGTISGGTGADSTGEIILTAGATMMDRNILNVSTDYSFNGTLELNANTTLALAGDGTQFNLGTLRVTGDTVIDFGSGDAIEFNLGALEISPGVTITVNNWISYQDLWTTSLFTGGFGSVTIDERDNNTAQITFTGFSSAKTIWLSSDFGTNEITVPEPSSYGAILMGFGLVMWTLRRPRRSDAPKFQVTLLRQGFGGQANIK